MLKKFLLIALLFLTGVLYSEEANGLPFYTETEHFQAYCLQKDVVATENILQDLEQFYKKCSQDFCYLPQSSEKIRLNLYPDIQAFHSTLKEKTLSQWKVCKFSSKDNCISLVTPKNPGTIHTEKTMMKCARHTLGLFFIHQKCKQSSPWMRLGLACYESKVYSIEELKQHLLSSAGEVLMPSFFQIDEQMKNGEFTSRSYPVAAYAYVEFLVKNWGWNKTLALLENYSSFETILQISQEDFQKKCIQYYQENLFSLINVE
jgi:hypothetical protein